MQGTSKKVYDFFHGFLFPRVRILPAEVIDHAGEGKRGGAKAHPLGSGGSKAPHYPVRAYGKPGAELRGRAPGSPVSPIGAKNFMPCAARLENRQALPGMKFLCIIPGCPEGAREWHILTLLCKSIAKGQPIFGKERLWQLWIPGLPKRTVVP